MSLLISSVAFPGIILLVLRKKSAAQRHSAQRAAAADSETSLGSSDDEAAAKAAEALVRHYCDAVPNCRSDARSAPNCDSQPGACQKKPARQDRHTSWVQN